MKHTVNYPSKTGKANDSRNCPYRLYFLLLFTCVIHTAELMMDKQDDDKKPSLPYKMAT